MGARAATARVQPGPARSRRRTRPRPSPKPRPRATPRLRVAGGVVWIGLVAVLLAGVVALNVAVLRLNVRFDELGREQTQLRAQNADLASEIATRAASARIQTIASGRLGLVTAGPGDWTYLDLSPRAR